MFFQAYLGKLYFVVLRNFTLTPISTQAVGLGERFSNQYVPGEAGIGGRWGKFLLMMACPQIQGGGEKFTIIFSFRGSKA